LNPDKIVLGKEVQITIDENAQSEFDARIWEVVMLIKLSVTNDMLPKVQDGDDAIKIWGHL
jgi:hypothetical protein